jgi:arginase/N-omega-hydroxy-L-arginine amidinohydrolase
MLGSRDLGSALSRSLNTALRIVGEPSAPLDDPWLEALHAAKPILDELQTLVVNELAAGRRFVGSFSKDAASIASIPPMAARYPDLRVVWFDAYGDSNTSQTTSSRYLGGMTLSAITGLWSSGYGSGLDPAHLILVGTRDLDPAVLDLIHSHGLRVVKASVDLPGQIAQLTSGLPTLVYVDWDVVDPAYVAKEYKVAGGMKPAELQACLAALGSTAEIVGLESSEYELQPMNTRRRL